MQKRRLSAMTGSRSCEVQVSDSDTVIPAPDWSILVKDPCVMAPLLSKLAYSVARVYVAPPQKLWRPTFGSAQDSPLCQTWSHGREIVTSSPPRVVSGWKNGRGLSYWLSVGL